MLRQQISRQVTHEFILNLKERIRSAQLKAAVSVNRELVLLYWQIGDEILTGRSGKAGVQRSSIVYPRI